MTVTLEAAKNSEGALAAWHCPVKLVAGAAAGDIAARLIGGLGRRVMVVTDAGVRKAMPFVDALTTALLLQDVDVRVLVQDAIPSIASLRDGLAVARSHGAEAIVGVGGGTCMDTAKLLAASLGHDDAITAFARSEQGLVRPVLPKRMIKLAQVPTTIGTASEMNAVAALACGEPQRRRLIMHPSLYADLAIIDPRFTASLPMPLLLGGAFEVLCRTLVPFITADSAGVSITDEHAVAVARTVLRAATALASSRDDEVARLDLALASATSISGFALLGRSPYSHVLWYLANDLSRFCAVSKVEAMAAAAPGYLGLVARSGAPELGDDRRLARVGAEIFGTGAAADPFAAVHAVTALLRAWNLPTSLRHIGLEEHDIDAVASETAALWRCALPWLTPARVRDVYAASFVDASSAL